MFVVYSYCMMLYGVDIKGLSGWQSNMLLWENDALMSRYMDLVRVMALVGNHDVRNSLHTHSIVCLKYTKCFKTV